jgi:NADH-quinone oxidoreductase subunit H
MAELLHSTFAFVPGWQIGLLCAAVIALAVLLMAGLFALTERKIIADLQARPTPTPVGPQALLQPISDALKLWSKQEGIPDNADRLLFWFSLVLAMTALLTSAGALAFGPWLQAARDINIGVLFVAGVSVIGSFGIALGGFALNDQESSIGALCSAAQLISYETAAGFAVASGFLLSGTLRVNDIVERQRTDQVWYVFLAPMGFFIYFVGSLAATNRARSDLSTSEAERVTGETEQCTLRGSLYILAEYANMIVVGAIGTTLFLGGWLRPFPNVRWMSWLDTLPLLMLAAAGAYCVVRSGKGLMKAERVFTQVVAVTCFATAFIFLLAAPLALAPLHFAHDALYGAFWFLLKVAIYTCIVLWLRILSPTLAFAESMRLGWHILTPLALANVFAVGMGLVVKSALAWSGALGIAAMLPTTIATISVGIQLIHWSDRHAAAASAEIAADDSKFEDSYAG